MEVLAVLPSEVRARKAREVLARELRATYESATDSYIYQTDGGAHRLVIRQVEGRYEYQVVLEEVEKLRKKVKE